MNKGFDVIGVFLKTYRYNMRKFWQYQANIRTNIIKPNTKCLNCGKEFYESHNLDTGGCCSVGCRWDYYG